MSKPLVIFDCDGVLVDTEARANARMAELFTELGLPLTGPQCRARFQGFSMASVSAAVSEDIGRTVDPDAIQAEINLALASGVAAIEGVEELVETLFARGYSVCVASSGPVDKMHLTLGQTRLLPLLKDLLFSATEVTRGKPHPDLFEHAARRMGHDSRNAVVLEDSLAGVQAGVAAGARVLGYCGDSFADRAVLAAAGAELLECMSGALAMIEAGPAPGVSSG